MKIGRVLVFFAVAFGSVVIPVVVGILVAFGAAEPAFYLDQERLDRLSSGGTGHLVGPGGAPIAVRLEDLAGQFPEAQEALGINFEDASVLFLTFGDAAKAAEMMDAYFEELSTRSMVRTPSRINYTLADGEVRGRMLLSGRWLLWARARDQETIDKRLPSVPFITLTERRGLGTTALVRLLAGVAAYIALLVVSWPRLATWASRVDADPGAEPVTPQELKRRLLAVSESPGPLSVEEGNRPGELIASWKYADAAWAGPLHAGGIRRLARLRMRLDEKRRGVKVQDQITKLDWDAGASGRAAASVGGFRGIIFGSYERGKGTGLIFRDGRLVYDESYSYRFSTRELKGTIVDIITGSGWSVLPVVTLGR